MRSPLDILYNFHWIIPGEAARASQAHFGGLGGFLRRHGIRALINLRGENIDLGWWQSETRVARREGVAHFDVMLDSRKLPTRNMLERLIVVFEEAPRPFLLKCSGGQDRTALAAALFLIHRDGWSARARADLQFARFPYLHFPRRHQRWLRLFPDFAAADAAGAPLGTWIRERYEPERMKTWLEGHGHTGTFAAVFSAPTRSRWQW
jgi:hypothetical protein